VNLLVCPAADFIDVEKSFGGLHRAKAFLVISGPSVSLRVNGLPSCINVHPAVGILGGGSAVIKPPHKFIAAKIGGLAVRVDMGPAGAIVSRSEPGVMKFAYKLKALSVGGLAVRVKMKAVIMTWNRIWRS
jgi:hypothetical protein